MRTYCVVALMLMATTAYGQTLYKCVAKGKPTSFQSEPCPPGTKTARAVAAVPERYTPPAYRPVPQATSPTHNVVYNNVPTQVRYDSRDQQRANCQAAKNQRQEILDRAGLNRTYDLLQRLDATVYNACKGL